jgi:hypothetical protein
MLYATWGKFEGRWLLRIKKDKFMLAPPLLGDEVHVLYKDGHYEKKYIGDMWKEDKFEYFFYEDYDPVDDYWYDSDYNYSEEDWLDD